MNWVKASDAEEFHKFRQWIYDSFPWVSKNEALAEAIWRAHNNREIDEALVKNAPDENVSVMDMLRGYKNWLGGKEASSGGDNMNWVKEAGDKGFEEQVQRLAEEGWKYYESLPTGVSPDADDIANYVMDMLMEDLPAFKTVKEYDDFFDRIYTIVTGGKDLEEKEAAAGGKKGAWCPKCGEPLQEETDEDLKKEYPYVCLNCDENFYGIETLEDPEKAEYLRGKMEEWNSLSPEEKDKRSKEFLNL